MARATKPAKARRAAAPPASPLPGRIPGVDAVRGVAVALMVGYHFCFDLDYFHLADFDFHRSPFWLAARAGIVTLFLLLVGVSLHLATARGLRPAPFARRLAVLMACAATVSAASYAMFPASGIFFGVLHFIALASLLGLPFARLGVANLALGAAWIAAGLLFSHAWFDQPWARWIGFMTHKPVTEDYVPLFPWFGVVLLGLFLGRHAEKWSLFRLPGRTGLPLELAGRHSLAIYMLHQPALLGLLYLVATLAG